MHDSETIFTTSTTASQQFFSFLISITFVLQIFYRVNIKVDSTKKTNVSDQRKIHVIKYDYIIHNYTCVFVIF